MKLKRAAKIAENLRKVLAPGCERIEIAGSIRRGRPTVLDVELVAIPKGLRTDLFGRAIDPNEAGKTDLDLILDTLLDQGLLEPRKPRRMGQRYKALRAVRTGIGLDLFLVLPPAQWGTIFAIRTGSAEFSKWCVTEARKRGHSVESGRVLDELRRPIPTPEESDFFRAVGVHEIPPERRS